MLVENQYKRASSSKLVIILESLEKMIDYARITDKVNYLLILKIKLN